jgi:hypothetical protein
VIVATRWAEYAALPGSLAQGQTVFDARRLLTPDAVTPADYLTIGRRMTA